MPTRRTVLGTAVVLLATGGGAVAGWQRPRSATKAQPGSPPPVWLATAISREQALIAGVSAAIAADAGTSARLSPLLDDHTAHLTALLALPGAPAPASAPTGSPDPSDSPGPATSAAPVAPSAAALLAAETAAGQAAATQSASQQGRSAVLLASIAACEDSHAQWLS